MIDHISLRVTDFDRAVAFYKEALAPLGYTVMMEFDGAIGMGNGMPDLWLMKTDKPLNPTHIALSASRDVVNAFHAAALAAGGSDNGAPGLRADYHPNYYAAFVHDPEGNNVEVVCHLSPDAPKAAKAASGGAKAKAAGKSSAKSAAAKPAGAKPAGKKAPAKAKAAAKGKPKAKPAKKKR